MNFHLSRRFCLTVILLVSVLMHLKGLASPVLDYHYHRQCNTAAIGRSYYEHKLQFFHPRIDWMGSYDGRAATEFPLYMFLIGVLWPFFLGELWGRLLAVLFSALTGVYLFRFLEEKLGREAAFYAGVLFSLIPLEIYFGRTVQPEALALLSTVAAFDHWERSLTPDRPPGDWLAAVFFAFFAISHKLPYVFMLIPMAYLAWQKLGKMALRDAGVLLSFPLIGLGVYGWYHHAAGGAYVVPAHQGEFLSLLDYKHLPYFVQFQFVSRFPELAATYGGLVLMFFGIREVVFRRKLVFFAVWFGAIAAHLIAGGRYTFSHEYTSLPLVPVNAAFMGEGLRLLRERAWAVRRDMRGWAWAALAVLVLAIPVHATLRIRHWYKLSYTFLLQAEKTVDGFSARDDLFITNDRTGSVFLYKMHRRGWGWDFRQYGEKDTFAQIDERLGQGAKYLLTEKTGVFADATDPIAKRAYARWPVVHDGDGMLVFRLEEKKAPARSAAQGKGKHPRMRK